MEFEINGRKWKILFVSPYDDRLKRSDGSRTVGMTDGNKNIVCISNRLRGAFLRKVVAHELTHCFIFSFDLDMSIEEEERLADWIATYGTELVYLLDDLMNMELKKRAV